MASSWAASVILVAVLVIIVLVSRVLSKSWFAPGSFFGVYWLVMTGAPLLFAPDFYVHAGAVGWVVLSVVVVLLGSLLGQALGSGGKLVPLSLGSRVIRPLRWAVLVSSALGMGVVVVHLAAFGLSLSVFTSVTDLAQAGRSFSVARYSEGYSGPLLARALLVPMYLACPLGGVLAGLSNVKLDRRLGLMPFIPVLGVMAILTTKATLLMSAAFWVGGLLAACVLQRRQFSDIMGPRGIVRLLAAGAGAFGLFVGTSMARYGWSGWDLALRVVDKLRLYAFGHLGGLSRWFEESAWRVSEPAWGSRTVAGLSDALGLAEREQGIFQVFAVLSPTRSTNIFTFHRGLIEDFTIPGAILVLFVVGLVAGRAFARLRRGRARGLGVVILFYAFTLFSFVTSLLNYNSLVLVSLILVIGAWMFAHRLRATPAALTHSVERNHRPVVGRWAQGVVQRRPAIRELNYGTRLPERTQDTLPFSGTSEPPDFTR